MQSTVFKRSSAPAIMLASLWLLLMDNGHYWQLISGLPLEKGLAGGWFPISIFVFSLALINLVLHLLTFGRASRYVLSGLLILSAAAAFFMDRYGVMFDQDMIQNLFETDRAEAMELMGRDMWVHLALYGVVPAVVICRLLPARQKVARILLEKAAVVALSVVVMALLVAPSFKEYAAMVRNHREIRYLLTPVNYLQSLYTYAVDLTATPVYATPIGTDAVKGQHWAGVQNKVVTVLVVGETARAGNFSLGGYERDTNPRLAGQDIVYFSNVSSCATATRVALPCMFSDLSRATYSKPEAKGREGLLDVLQHAGIRTLWFDNNAGCKGACEHTPTWTAYGLNIDGQCVDGECLDSVLVDQLQQALAATAEDTVIVLHQNGSHGPAYYRRYPEAFRQFTPDCRSDEFADCSREEIVNSYDNTIYYTDFFLSQVIALLDRYATQFDTALLYVSDHGESLGEYGLYLHGTPYFVAPDVQTRVPMLLWLSPAYQNDFHLKQTCLQGLRDTPLSHDNLFHSMLGLLDIATTTRDARLDVFANCHEGRPPKPAATGRRR